MGAGEHEKGFRLGEWRVEPRQRQLVGAAGTHSLETEELGVLLRLAAGRGEIVPRRTLCHEIWPDEPDAEERLRAAVGSLRLRLGGSARDLRYIASIGRNGYALVARVEPLENDPADSGPPPPAAPSAPIGRLHALLAELRRRSVFKVSGAYLLGMWLVLQVAETTFEPLRLPSWWMTALTILAVLGLPIVAVLAWSYEITAGGIVVDGERTGVRLPRARRALAPALVAGVALMAGVTGYAWWRTIESSADATVDADRVDTVAPAARSIAVLPLVDMSPAGDAAYLGDGLSEELSSDLAKVPGLRVAARTSAFAYKGKSIDVRRIGEQLGVRYVLEGSVRREGDRVRVTAQLIDAATGFHVWTESYDRPWQDLIGIQQEISRAIAGQLEIVLPPEMQARLETAATRDPRAYDFYLAGLSQLRQGGGMTSLAEAESLFRRALEADPAFSRAQAALCEVGVTRYQRTRVPEEMQAAETACRKALEGDPGLVETALALGKLYLAGGRYEQSEAVHRGIVARMPGNADAHVGLGRALEHSNRPAEAELSFREAVAAEPGYWAAHNALGGFLFNHGRTDEAVEAYRRVTQLQPRNPTGFGNLGAAYLALGQFDEAVAAFEESTRLEPSRDAYSNLGTASYFRGRMQESVGWFDRAIELAPQDYLLWGNRADARWFLVGQREAAREDYRRAADLAERALAVNPNDGDTWALLGHYYGRIGERERSARSSARAMELSPDSPYVGYFAAVAAAERGEREHAARMIARAIENGYPKVLTAPDPALEGIPIG